MHCSHFTRCALGLLLGSLGWGCGLLEAGGGSAGGEGTTANKRKAVAVEMPWVTTEERDKERAPVVRVELLDDGAAGVPVPYIYGYPLYAEGDAARGILMLRHDAWDSREEEVFEDDSGVVHRVERLSLLDCVLEGIKESEAKFVPTKLSCNVPAPKALGGPDRPVIGELGAGAKPEDVLQQPQLAKAFYGDWHFKDQGLSEGNGTGYLNTDHGQLGFGFRRNRLRSVSYHFDPGQVWNNPLLWVRKP